MKVEAGSDSFYNKVINEFAKKEMKNWIDLQINFNNPLFVDLLVTNSSHHHHHHQSIANSGSLRGVHQVQWTGVSRLKQDLLVEMFFLQWKLVHITFIDEGQANNFLEVQSAELRKYIDIFFSWHNF